VHLSAAGEFIGSGFLVAPGLVVTCAHVPGRAPAGELAVHHGALRCTVRRADFTPLPATTDTESGPFYPFPDLAVIRVPEFAHLRAVELAAADPPTGRVVTVVGFSRYTPVRGPEPLSSGLLLKIGGPDGPYLRIIEDEVKDGLSGGMVVNHDAGPDQGRVCGVVKGSRDFNGARGGWITPVSALRQLLDSAFPGALPSPAVPDPTAAPAATAVVELTLEQQDRLVDLLEGVWDGGPRFQTLMLQQMARYLDLPGEFPAGRADTAREQWTLVVQRCLHRTDKDRAFHAIGWALERLRPGDAVVREVQTLLGGEW
jgi:hypothetical protein